MAKSRDGVRHHFLWVAPVCAAVAGFFLGEGVDHEAQRDLMGNLQSVGAVVFGIVGAWVAIIFPHAQGAANSPENVNREEIAKSYHRLLTPLIVSCVLFIVLLVCMPIFAVLNQFCDKGVVGRVSFSVICASTVLQIGAVFLSLGPVVDTRRLIAASARRQSVVDGSTANTQQVTPPES